RLKYHRCHCHRRGPCVLPCANPPNMQPTAAPLDSNCEGIVSASCDMPLVPRQGCFLTARQQTSISCSWKDEVLLCIWVHALNPGHRRPHLRQLALERASRGKGRCSSSFLGRRRP